jgi:hypothetical protein
MKPLVRVQQFLTFLFVPVLLGVVGLFFVVKVFGALTTDTTAITNTAFVAIASLAALSFGWVRSLMPNDQRQWRIRFAGEQLTQAALLVLSASLLKYALLATGASSRHIAGQSLAQRISSHGVALTSVDLAGGLLVVLLFSAAVVSAVIGILALSRALHEPVVP